MIDIIDIPEMDYSEEVRFGSRPAVTFYLGSASYFNKKASSILDLHNEDILGIFYHEPSGKWFIGNGFDKGINVRKDQSNFKFCDSKNIRRLFNHYQIKGRKASFLLGSELEKVSNPEVKVLLIKPKPFNIK